MIKFIVKKSFSIKLIICLLFSILIYLSFRTHLIYEDNLKILISFILIIFVIWSIILLPKKKRLSIFFYNLFFIVLLNLIFTPLFHLITFDVPTRQPNYKIVKEYKGEFFKGMFSGKHFISSDEKGYRTNKKIDYDKKSKNTFRIFTIGASTTEEGSTDNNKTWSTLLGKKLSRATDKNVEVVNAGMAGLRTEHHYFTLKRIQKYKPDLLIFLIGINDWNYHIINDEKKYLFPIYEIKYDFKKSILFSFFENIDKQIKRKLNKNTKNKKILNLQSPELDAEAYLLPQIDSLNIRKNIKSFKPKNISQDYEYWINLIIKECKKIDSICLFLDQPTAYKKNISEKLKKRLWMTPPNKDYTLNFEDLILLSSTYNNWLKKKITDNNLNFCLLSDKINANTNHLTDDCHFSEEGSKKVSNVITNCVNLSLKSSLY